MKLHKKIAIIGNAGSGKSTLALELHKKLNIPLFHLDQYYWKPGWCEPDKHEFEQIHNQLCDQDSWIIEGIATRLFACRAAQADVIIFLDVLRYVCLYRVLHRALMHWGNVLHTSAPGCPERGPDWKFLKFIWTFDQERRQIILNSIKSESLSKKVIIIKNNQDIESLMYYLYT